jgi:tetratricopeptide (TPR) repeat protein
MLKKLLLLLFLSFCSALFSQNNVDSLEQVLAGSPQDTNRVQLLFRLSRIFDSNDQKRSKIYLAEALTLSKKLSFKTGETNALIQLGIIAMETNNYGYTDSCLQEALKLAKEQKDSVFQGIIYNNIGMVRYEVFDYPGALESYFTAARIFEELNMESKLTSTINNIANIYFTQKRYDKALEYHLKSLAISKKIGAKSNVASSLNNLGLVYREMKDYKKAMEAYEEALQIAIEVNHRIGQSLLWNNLGKCHRIVGNYSKALECFEKALVIKIEMGDANGVAHTYNNIGDLYFDMKDYKRSIEYNLKSIVESEKKHNIGTLQNAYQSLAYAYKEINDYKKAYDYHMKFIELKDSIFDIEKSEQLAEMSTRFETEKKDKELIKKDAEIKFQAVESKQKETQRNAFVVGFILVGLLALFIFKGLRDKQKANKKLTSAYEEIDLKNKIVEEKNKNITDSINYARRIQAALLASDTLLEKNLPEYFILYKPKDIVSGDFYWAANSKSSGESEEFLICTGDCTGHGVPGAFMSLLGVSSLNEIVLEKRISQPNLILDELRAKLVNVLNPKDSVQKSYDGMDCSICKYNFKKMELEFAAANNGIWIISDSGVLKEYKADKQPVGYHSEPVPFTLQKVKLQKGDTIYTFTDGFADQFGGPKGKKFKYKQLQQLLIANSGKPLDYQKDALISALGNWQGPLEQIDDILIIGIKV